MNMAFKMVTNDNFSDKYGKYLQAKCHVGANVIGWN